MAIVILGGLGWWWSLRPSNNRQWTPNQAVLAEPVIAGTAVFIKNIRHFAYRSEEDYTARYYDKKFDLTKLQRVYLIFVPFKDSPYAAHACLSFEFEPESYVTVSVEVRRKNSEDYSAVKGLFKHYELMYVIADEEDIITLRTHCRNNDVFMYPLKIDRAMSQALFVAMMKRARELVQQPEFYHTIRNACMTNLAAHFNAISSGSIPFNVRLVMSGYADRYLHELGLLDTDLPFDQARERFYISERARGEGQPGAGFSRALRI